MGCVSYGATILQTVGIVANQLPMSIDYGLKIMKFTRVMIGTNINCKCNMQIYVCGLCQYLLQVWEMLYFL